MRLTASEMLRRERERKARKKARRHPLRWPEMEFDPNASDAMSLHMQHGTPTPIRRISHVIR
jgi:hypothetical protein